MALFRKLLLIAVMVSLACAVFAQTAVSLSLEAEIQNMERNANRQGITAEERHGHLVRLARLRQLSGDIEGAARNWLEAAAAIPGIVDDEALLACAFNLAAMGEWERAAAAVEPLAARYPRARFLDAGIIAINTGDTSILVSLASDPLYSQIRSEIYFLLWKLSGGADSENWRRRLIAEFPQSPEGRLASANTSSVTSAISIRPSPFWLLMGFDSLSAVSSPVPLNASVSTPPASSVQSSVTGVRLQTGLFSREANAQAQAETLRQAGYSALVEQRTANNNPMWAVTVLAGSDINQTIRELREAGFESFPLR